LAYFDAAYIAKCYLNEPNASLIRQFAYQSDSLISCEIARVEFYSVVQRHLREGNITAQDSQQVLKDFDRDEKDGVWNWIQITHSLIQTVCEYISSLPPDAFLRAVDAIHLACAAENGFNEIYSNDRHMLGSARHFGLKGINLIP
jgi:predicted nucleic acid-binding protein